MTYRRYLNTMRTQVKRFIDEHNKRPTQHSKDQDEKRIGKWIGTQIKNAKNRTHIMKDDDVYSIWNAFVTNVDYHQYFKTSS